MVVPLEESDGSVTKAVRHGKWSHISACEQVEVDPLRAWYELCAVIQIVAVANTIGGIQSSTYDGGAVPVVYYEHLVRDDWRQSHYERICAGLLGEVEANEPSTRNQTIIRGYTRPLLTDGNAHRAWGHSE